VGGSVVESIAAVGGGAFVLVSLVLGVRLLMLAARTHEIPEFACGLGLLLMGAVGYPLVAITQQVSGLPTALRVGLLIVQMLCHVVGNTALCIFTLRVFRPDAAWARGLTAAVLLAVVTSIAIQMASPGLAAFVENGRGIWRLHGGIAIVPLLWTGFESLRYRGLLQRRRKLGLADPVIVNRFQLWAVGMLLAASVTVVSISLELQGQTMVDVPIGGLAIGVLGTLCSGAMWLAFMPPATYTRWLAARQA